MAEADPPDLWHEYLRPAPIQFLDTPGVHPGHTEALMLPLLAPAGATVSAREEVSPRLVKIPQCLLLNHARPSGQPGFRFAGLGELTADPDDALRIETFLADNMAWVLAQGWLKLII